MSDEVTREQIELMKDLKDAYSFDQKLFCQIADALNVMRGISWDRKDEIIPAIKAKDARIKELEDQVSILAQQKAQFDLDHKHIVESLEWTKTTLSNRDKHIVEQNREIASLKTLLDCKNETANTFMNQVKKLQAADVIQDAEITRLNEALKNFGKHKWHCRNDGCTCGFDEALSQTKEGK